MFFWVFNKHYDDSYRYQEMTGHKLTRWVPFRSARWLQNCVSIVKQIGALIDKHFVVAGEIYFAVIVSAEPEHFVANCELITLRYELGRKLISTVCFGLFFNWFSCVLCLLSAERYFKVMTKVAPAICPYNCLMLFVLLSRRRSTIAQLEVPKAW